MTEAPTPAETLGPQPDRATERAFYIQEFARATVVVALDAADLDVPDPLTQLAQAARSLGTGDSRLVLVVGTDDPVADAASIEDRLDAVLPGRTPLHPFPGPVAAQTSGAVGATATDAATADGLRGQGNGAEGSVDDGWLADLWLSVLDHGVVTVTVPTVGRSLAAAHVAAALRALKLVVTDDAGGWGRPPRSFADVSTHGDAYRSQLGDRQGGAVVAAIETALAGGVTSVNLCRAGDVDRELFTFDGAGTLFTSGGYVEVVPLSIDDLSAIEDLMAQGIADGLLRPRTRREVARLAVSGLGAKVVGSGHLAGVVGLETEAYRAEALGEVAGLYTVSRFSGSGAGGLLIDALLARSSVSGLRAVFAVTVSGLAAEFFERRGFREVAQDQVPEAKWDGYDSDRRSAARVFWHDTADDTPGF